MAVDIDPTGEQIQVLDAAGLPLAVDPPQALVRITRPNGSQATFFPGVGFNLVDWRIPRGDGWLRVIHAEDDVLSGGSGTRSGVPILFPFPNRLAGAQFTFDGRRYRLPPRSAEDPNAIHGFCAKAEWQDYSATGDDEVTARFRLSRDADRRQEWPGDLELAVTFTLGDQTMRITSKVANPDSRPVPFGLGFHSYFTPLGDTTVDEMRLRVGADRQWRLDAQSIPTGEVTKVLGDTDLRADPVLGARVLDDVLTGLRPFVPETDGLMERARLTGGSARLALRCDAEFQDLVVFTPARRSAVAVEPYTCPTDAVHLAERGMDVGWRVLQPGEAWTGVVELRVQLT